MPYLSSQVIIQSTHLHWSSKANDLLAIETDVTFLRFSVCGYTRSTSQCFNHSVSCLHQHAVYTAGITLYPGQAFQMVPLRPFHQVLVTLIWKDRTQEADLLQ